MAAKIVRVVVEIAERGVTIALVNANGVRVEDERFGLAPQAASILPLAVGRDVFNLLYQCASDAVTASDGTP